MSTNGHIEPRIILTLLLGDKPTMERKRKVAKLLGDKIRRCSFSVGYVENIAAGRQIPPLDGGMYRAIELVMEEVVTALIEKVV